MDLQSPRENEALLHSFVEGEDPHVVGLVGIEALTALAHELPAEKFRQFLQQAVGRATQLKQGIQSGEESTGNSAGATQEESGAPAANPAPEAQAQS